MVGGRLIPGGDVKWLIEYPVNPSPVHLMREPSVLGWQGPVLGTLPAGVREPVAANFGSLTQKNPRCAREPGDCVGNGAPLAAPA